MGLGISDVLLYEGLVILSKSIPAAQKPRVYVCKASWCQSRYVINTTADRRKRHVGFTTGLLSCVLVI